MYVQLFFLMTGKQELLNRMESQGLKSHAIKRKLRKII